MVSFIVKVDNVKFYFKNNKIINYKVFEVFFYDNFFFLVNIFKLGYWIIKLDC